jgi:hypothetical protein
MLMTAIASHRSSGIIRSAYALCAASFLFFLIYTAPHRVHHLFNQFEAADHHGARDHHSKSDHRDPSSSDSNCVFQVSANRCAVGLTPLIQPLPLTQFVQRLLVSQEKTRPRQFLTAAFHIRAPPKA